ncbi:MAG: winged helix DNA-binding domain-containing protein [Roseovarius sp.]|nr:winged helix DNA-binding domain-containing protein [Roseovarius sp.]MCY4317215.1 winged helix DNA-binding domain-containing protein [Roseovarius sp.]
MVFQTDMGACLKIGNKTMRRLWLTANGIADNPSGPVNVIEIIRSLGFLQIDTIRNVTRAHHHILWSRNRNYRENMLWPLLKQRELFEHFTHDASLIPMEMLPYWQRQFRKMGALAQANEWYGSGLAKEQLFEIRQRIEAEGPLSTRAFDTRATDREMWSRPPHKKALEQMWYAGDLATSHRENFIKYYDLGERVFPKHLRDCPGDDISAQKLCDEALERLWVASLGEIRRFWDAVKPEETENWCKERKLTPVEVECADGTCRKAWATTNIEEKLEELGSCSRSRMRILNPFDPAIRDRDRLERIFGFAYRNEMFVPKAKRKWGYYIYPLLEGDRFAGRCEIKADRKAGWMKVSGLWPESKIHWGAERRQNFSRELKRFARLAGIGNVEWHFA